MLFHFCFTYSHIHLISHIYKGFYVAASDKFVNVERWVRVGASSFLHAYQHSNNRDLVPLVQFTNFQGINPFGWQFYKHVGMRIQLHDTGRLAKRSLRNALDVTYQLHHDWLSEGKRMVVQRHPNLTTPAGCEEIIHWQSINKGYTSRVNRMALAKSSEFSVTCELSYVPYSHLMFTSISYRIIRFSSLLSWSKAEPNKDFGRVLLHTSKCFVR